MRLNGCVLPMCAAEGDDAAMSIMASDNRMSHMSKMVVSFPVRFLSRRRRHLVCLATAAMTARSAYIFECEKVGCCFLVQLTVPLLYTKT